MKLTTKRNRWFFWRELFLYMIPMILIVGTIDVFYHFVQCPLHPEWSAPCSVNRLLAAIYGVFLLLTIVFAIISAKMLRKVKKQIENEFTETINNNVKEYVEEIKQTKPKKVIAKTGNKPKKRKELSITIKKKKGFLVENSFSRTNRISLMII